MSTQGSTTVSFGSFPGSITASTTITGQTNILSTSLCEAWIDPTQTATVTHSQDEHTIIDMDVRCENIIAGTGFTIVCTIRSGTFTNGSWNISWVWN